MEKGNLISLAFLRLGRNSEYNDNKTTEHKIATLLLDHVINNLAKDTAYLFNSTTVTLTQFEESTNVMGENRFNIPNDLLNFIRADVPVRIEGEFIYTTEKTVQLQYCRSVDISDMPDYLADLIIYMLCAELCLAFNSYLDRIQAFKSAMMEERAKIISNQFNNFSFPS